MHEAHRMILPELDDTSGCTPVEEFDDRGAHAEEITPFHCASVISKPRITLQSGGVDGMSIVPAGPRPC